MLYIFSRYLKSQLLSSIFIVNISLYIFLLPQVTVVQLHVLITTFQSQLLLSSCHLICFMCCRYICYITTHQLQLLYCIFLVLNFNLVTTPQFTVALIQPTHNCSALCTCCHQLVALLHVPLIITSVSLLHLPVVTTFALLCVTVTHLQLLMVTISFSCSISSSGCYLISQLLFYTSCCHHILIYSIFCHHILLTVAPLQSYCCHCICHS